jgi:GxxExxY protein
MDREYTYRVIGCIYEVFNQLGPGLLESIYEAAMVRELKLNGFEVKSQVEVPVYYKGELICPNLRLDIIVDDKLILELKSVIDYRKLFEKQLLTYLKLMNCELGYVINFTTENIRDSIYPVVNPDFRRHSTPPKRDPYNPFRQE